MNIAAPAEIVTEAPSDPVAAAGDAVAAVDAALDGARAALAARVSAGEQVSNAALESEQWAAHVLAWAATYGESLRQMADWARRLSEAGRFGEAERLILEIAFGEYLAQLRGGFQMSQGEIGRLSDLGVAIGGASVEALIAAGCDDAKRRRLAEIMAEREGAATVGACGLDDEFEMVRDQFRRFSDEKVAPHAHQWHLEDALIPMEIISEMADLGVFGLTIPEEHGGFGMGKTAMCVVSEELSRGYIGVGSLGTRSEIAAELILCEIGRAHV